VFNSPRLVGDFCTSPGSGRDFDRRFRRFGCRLIACSLSAAPPIELKSLAAATGVDSGVSVTG